MIFSADVTSPDNPDNLTGVRKYKKVIVGLVLALVVVAFLNFIFFSSPANFPTNTPITIEEGMNLREVSLKLKQEGVIRSRTIFEALVIIYGGEKSIKHSDYLFGTRLTVFGVASRVSKGDYGAPPIKVTIPEGFDTTQIADAFASKLASFNKEEFLFEASVLEGYLFPDTYFFFTEDDEQDVLEAMRANYENKIKSLRADIEQFSKTEQEIIIMASLIEGEAKGNGDRKFISGILWKRLAIDMPLQVDVAQITYKERGLPEQPIGNPGIKSIQAAIFPKESSYLYYLHDPDGNIHYAKNFEEHKRNKAKYLNN